MCLCGKDNGGTEMSDDIQPLLEAYVDEEGSIIVRINSHPQQPAYWGIILADIARNILKMHEEALIESSEIDSFAQAMFHVMRKEIQKPTSDIEEQRVQ